MTSAFDPVNGGPCATLAEAAVHARRPFTSALVQARIWTQTDGGADVVYFVDVRAVIDRLNVLLPGRWHAGFELVDRRPPGLDGGDPALVYRCDLHAAEETYTDVGEGPDHKAARSDALKRAAVHLGIGHCLYRIGRVRMRPGPGRHQLRGATGWFELDERNRRWLRGRYRAWLVREGIAEYGLALDHGRAARSVAPELYPADLRARIAARTRGGVPAEATTLPPALAAVPDSPPPASTSQHAALVAIARDCGYGAATLEALVACVHDTPIERLGERALHDVRGYLDSAAGGRVGDAELATRIAELATPAPGLPPAGERLAAWLLQREEAAAA